MLPKGVEGGGVAGHGCGRVGDQQVFVIEGRATCPVVAACRQNRRVEQREFVMHVRFAIVRADGDAGARERVDIRALVGTFLVVGDQADGNAPAVRLDDISCDAVIGYREYTQIDRGARAAQQFAQPVQHLLARSEKNFVVWARRGGRIKFHGCPPVALEISRS